MGTLTRLGFVLRKGWRRVFGKSNGYIRQRYAEADYLEAYAEHTDIRVRRDPHAAVGGQWFVHGGCQLAFLRSEGLRPGHRLLDIGCGTLRAGRHFARFLDPGRYTGVDISSGALTYAKRVVESEGLGPRQPRLILNRHKRLTFDFCPDERFDYLMAFSVFTHLDSEHIEEGFAHLGKVMHRRSVFYFSYNDAPEPQRLTLKDFRYPFAFFEALAARHGFAVQDVTKRFDDPSGQRLVRLVRTS